MTDPIPSPRSPEGPITTGLGSQWMTKGGPVPTDVAAAIIATGGRLSPEMTARVSAHARHNVCQCACANCYRDYHCRGEFCKS